MPTQMSLHSPLQLRQHFLLETTLKECEKCANESGSIWIPGNPSVKSTFQHVVDDPYHSKITLSVENGKVQEKDNIEAWSFSIKLVGFFEFLDQKTQMNKAKCLSFINGSSLLYGIARDVLYSLSLRGQKPSVLLPSYTFQPWAEKFEQDLIDADNKTNAKSLALNADIKQPKESKSESDSSQKSKTDKK